jgi:heat shock protein HtpX
MYSAIAANKRNTFLIVSSFILLLGGIAWLWGAYSGNGSSVIWIVGFVIAYTVFQYYAGSRLAITMSGAKQIEKKDNPRLWNIVENLSISQGMPMPKVYVIQDPAPNAFATGRNPEHAVVASTTGLLEIMDDNELEGVMAHEMAHVKNYDIRVSMIVFGLISAIGILADFAIRMAWFSRMGRGRQSGQLGMILIVIGAVGMIITWLIGPLVSAAVSRQREYLADASGIEMTRYPDGLASALTKLGEYGKPMKRANSAMAHMYINDPIKPGIVERVFSTHPPLPKRVERLNQMGKGF